MLGFLRQDAANHLDAEACRDGNSVVTVARGRKAPNRVRLFLSIQAAEVVKPLFVGVGSKFNGKCLHVSRMRSASMLRPRRAILPRVV